MGLTGGLDAQPAACLVRRRFHGDLGGASALVHISVVVEPGLGQDDHILPALSRKTLEVVRRWTGFHSSLHFWFVVGVAGSKRCLGIGTHFCCYRSAVGQYSHTGQHAHTRIDLL